MALVPATITVNFTSNYTGDHRVCYRLGGVGPYDCTTVVTCLGGGFACSASISILVDDAACTDYNYDGYVQAICEDEGSLVGRVAWTATYSPTNACKSIVFTCTAPGGSSYCSGFSIDSSLDCGGATVTVPDVEDGTIFNMCFPTGATIPAPTNFTAVEGVNTCCECLQYTFTTGSKDGGTYFYQDCTTKQFVSAIIGADSTLTVCAITGTAQVEFGSGIVTSVGGSCPIT